MVLSGSNLRMHDDPMNAETAAFLPLRMANITQQSMKMRECGSFLGQGGQTLGLLSQSSSCSNSSTDSLHVQADERKDDDAEMEDNHRNRSSLWYLTVMKKLPSVPLPNGSISKLLDASRIFVNIVDRAILILGFVALLTGGVIYAGIFVSCTRLVFASKLTAKQRGSHIFNGIAHFIKGGIFFWYGLLTLGRWAGCFADMGWAWNITPAQSRIKLFRSSLPCPSAEFVESFVIFLYGCSNVFLEHLAGWGEAWTAQDLEHVSIAVMFFGGGLVRRLLRLPWKGCNFY